jgi:hypothetical protein
MTSLLRVILATAGLLPLWGAESLHIPACTAYLEPDPAALHPSDTNGIDGWSDGATSIVWHGWITTPGMLDLSVTLRLPQGATAQLRLTAAGADHSAQAVGAGDQAVVVPFGQVAIAAPGYQRFELHGLARTGKTFGRIESLQLDGPASAAARFNLLPRRNAASVHLGYPTPAEAQITAFYNEVAVREDPVWSYFMVCGFARGYFGIQVNSPTERRIIFSIWDSGKEGVDRSKVAATDRVTLLAKGEGVVASDFGNEGTGGHSHLIYPWVAGTTYRLLVTIEPHEATTRYSGYFFFPEQKRWGLIASFSAPKDGHYLRGLYSFNENFVGTNGDRRRMAEYGNQWIRLADGHWNELLTAHLTHDPTGERDRLDYTARLAEGRFLLANGGFLDQPPHDATITRAALGIPPDVAQLPAPVHAGP